LEERHVDLLLVDVDRTAPAGELQHASPRRRILKTVLPDQTYAANLAVS